MGFIGVFKHADVKIGAEQAKLQAEISYLQQKIKEFEGENNRLRKEVEDYKSFINRRMMELGEWKERISSSGLIDSPGELKRNYDDFLKLKKVFSFPNKHFLLAVFMINSQIF